MFGTDRSNLSGVFLLHPCGGIILFSYRLLSWKFTETLPVCRFDPGQYLIIYIVQEKIEHRRIVIGDISPTVNPFLQFRKSVRIFSCEIPIHILSALLEVKRSSLFIFHDLQIGRKSDLLIKIHIR